ncbi:hypothetical protein [Pandoraea pnomenusa]|uniref:hypothetical protein n=1 Tax=Pandoraea pnomenusa TaxID=93220 RepID=UPI00334136CD
MKRIAMFCFGALLAVALTGCAGTNFVRPADTALQNGKTTLSDVRTAYGSPYRESSVSKNDQDVKLLSYAYAAVGGTPVEAGVTPARSLSLAFWQDRLVSNVFVSSFKEDASTFDDAKRSAIVKGKTTRTDVIALLGRPAGYAIYPAIKEKDGQALVYSYTATSGSAFSLKISKRELIVTVDPNDIVTDVSYESVGMK